MTGRVTGKYMAVDEFDPLGGRLVLLMDSSSVSWSYILLALNREPVRARVGMLAELSHGLPAGWSW